MSPRSRIFSFFHTKQIRRGRLLVLLVQALFFEVTAEKADQLCSTSRLPQSGQAVFSASCSAMVRIFKKGFLQALQKNS
jgi:hypothetical protein